MLQEELKKRMVPDVLQFNDGRKVVTKDDWAARRKEIIHLLCSQEYGFPPAIPEKWSAEIESEDKNYCGGTVTLSKIMLNLELREGNYQFPMYSAIPNRVEKKIPAFVHICFRDNIPDKYMPVEEICDNGFAIFAFCYQDIVPDKKEGLSEGLRSYLQGRKEIPKIAEPLISAWAASRVMDYVQTIDSIDRSKIAVVGHSRLGNRFVSGGLDPRFSHVISNDSDVPVLL